MKTETLNGANITPNKSTSSTGYNGQIKYLKNSFNWINLTFTYLYVNQKRLLKLVLEVLKATAFDVFRHAT